MGKAGPVSRRLARRGQQGAARRTWENPSTPLSDPDDWLFDELCGPRSTAGVRVNRETALTISAFYRGVASIARDISKVPLVIYKKIDSGEERGRVRATDHPAYRLLRYKPNEYMNGMQFIETMVGHLKMDGNAYAIIERDAKGRPTALLPTNPMRTYPVRANGVLWYVVEFGEKGRMVRLDPSNVLHFKGLSFDGLIGYSVLHMARESLGTSLATREYGSRFFSGGGRPGVILEHPGTMTEPAQTRLKASWDKMYSGLENAHKTAILEEGMKANVLSESLKDSQLAELQQFQVRDVANWLGIPPHKLGDTARTSYNSIEQENQSYLDEALDGDMRRIECEVYEKLLTEEEKDQETHTIEFMRQALVRADIKTRFESYQIGSNMGVFDIDDIREKENMNPLPGGQGKVRMVPLNMQSVASLASKITALDGQSEDSLAFKRKVVELLLGDDTANDVIYNLTDVEQLLEEVGLALNDGAKAPWLPIIAAAGPAVSGETTLDEDGDVIGGAIEDSPAHSPTSPPASPPTAAVPADPETSPARAHARQILRDAVLRMAGRIHASTKRATRRPDTFDAKVEQSRIQHERDIREALAPVIGLLDQCDPSESKKRATKAARRMLANFGLVTERIAAGVPQSQFAAAIDWAGRQWINQVRDARLI